MAAVAIGEDTLDGADARAASLDFATWVEPHLRVLSAVAVQQVGRHDSADLVQDTLLRAWQKRDTFDPRRGSVRGWLIAVLLDRARRRRTARHVHLPPSGSPVPEPESAATPVSVEQTLDIHDAIAALPPRQRQIVTLHYVGGLTLAEVAVALRISVGATKSQLHDAKAALRQTLRDDEDER